MHMTANRVFDLVFIGAGLFFGVNIENNAIFAEELYRQVYAGDIIQGYVPTGQRIETSGHFWISERVDEGEAFLNVNLPSAQVPLIVEISRLAKEKRDSAHIHCTAKSNGHVGGCDATVRGETGMTGKRRIIFADDLFVHL